MKKIKKLQAAFEKSAKPSVVGGVVIGPVDGKPNYLEVMLSDKTTVQAFNLLCPPSAGLRVLLEADKYSVNRWRVIAVRDAYSDDFPFPIIMRHGQIHSWMGGDTTYVYTRQIMPLRVSVNTINKIAVDVYPGWYDYNGTIKYFEAVSAYSLSSYIPTSGARYVLLSIDSANALKVTAGTVATIQTIDNYIPTLPEAEQGLALIRLLAGTRRIRDAKTNTDLNDIRFTTRGSLSFRKLNDAPDSYTGQGGKFVKVKANELELEFSTDAPVLTNVDSIQFNTAGIANPAVEGMLSWNPTDGTLNVGMPGGDVVNQVGQEIFIPRRVKNTSGSDMYNGQLVYISGGDGTNAYIALAKADAEATSAYTLAMLTENIADGQKGFATMLGLVRDVDTIAYTVGTELYLSPSTAGAYTSTKTSAPNHMVSIGTVFRQHATEGAIIVHITNGFELSELHDVAVSGLANGDVLTYNSVSGLWENEVSNAFNGGTITNDLTISNTAPSLNLSDTTASAKDLTIKVDANIADLRETAGASGSLLALDLTNNRVGIGTNAPSAAQHIKAAASGIGQIIQVDATTPGNALEVRASDGATISSSIDDNGNIHLNDTTSGASLKGFLFAKLAISGVTKGYIQYTTPGGYPGIRFVNAAANEFHDIVHGQSDYFTISGSTAAKTKVVIGGSGFTNSVLGVLGTTASKPIFIIQLSAAQSANSLTIQDSSSVAQFAIAGNGRDFVLDETTGSKIGTATTQKLAFWNATPITQPANTVAIDTVLTNTGLRASGGTANFGSSVSVSSSDAFYLGDANTDGSWRFIRSGNNLNIERRESGSWVSKSIIAP